jgi:hypothetical protein
MVLSAMTERDREGLMGSGAPSGGLRVRDVVRAVVAEVASEELPVVEGLLRLDDDTVLRRLRRRSRPSEPLGFGLGEVVALATPVLWLVLDEAGRRKVGAAVGGTEKRTWVLWRKVFRRRPAPATVPPLTREQIAEVRQRVLELAAQYGVEQPKAVALADAMVTRLVLPEPDDAAGSRSDVTADMAAHLEGVPTSVPPVDWIAESDDITFPISVYLADGADSHAVEGALEGLLREIGIDVVERDDPVIGSWFRRMRGRIRDTARSPIVQELAEVLTHAADSRGVLAHDAAVTANLMENLGPLLTSLQPTKDAVLRVGALLIVKVDWTVAVHQLTTAQQLRLNHQPQLLTSPNDILYALDLNPNSVTNQPHHTQAVQAIPEEATPGLEPDRDRHRHDVSRPVQQDGPAPRTEKRIETDRSAHFWMATDAVHDWDDDPGSLPDLDDLEPPYEQPRKPPDGPPPPPEAPALDR